MGGMNLNYEPWKLYVLVVLALAVVVFLQPYFREAEREKDRLKKQASVKEPTTGRLGR